MRWSVRHHERPDERAKTDEAQFQYLGQILLILVLALTKLSMTWFLRHLTQMKRIVVACNLLFGSVLGWATVSLFAFAFQCPLHEPWIYSPEKCAGVSSE